MVKIWEVNFTNFSGVSNVAFDEVGSQHLVTSSGIVKESPMPGFTYRPGILFSNNSTQQAYPLRTAGITNACFAQAYNRRSFVMWIYLASAVNNATFFDTGNAISFWGEWSGSTWNDGFGKNTSQIVVRVAGSEFSTGSASSAGWHLFILTVDKLLLSTNFYYDNSLIASTTNIPSNTPGTADCYLGDSLSTREGTYEIGLCSVYDHILTAQERQAIWDTFLKDQAVIVGQTGFQSFSGTLYGSNGTPQSGAKHYLIYEPTGFIVSSGSTSSSGTYQIDLPYSGAYTAMFTNTPSAGSRSFPVIATATGVYFP